LPSGTYDVFTTWVANTNRAPDAPYTISDGATALGTVAVNQKVAPAGVTSHGATWSHLGAFAISSGTLTVQLAASANGFVIADAIRLVRTIDLSAQGSLGTQGTIQGQSFSIDSAGTLDGGLTVAATVTPAVLQIAPGRSSGSPALSAPASRAA